MLIGLIEANREYVDELFVNIYLKEERIILQKIKIRAATYFLKAKLLTIDKDFGMAQMYFNRAEKIQNKFELSKSENGVVIQNE